MGAIPGRRLLLPSPGAWPSPWAMGSSCWHFGNLLDQGIKVRYLFQSYPISVLPLCRTIRACHFSCHSPGGPRVSHTENRAGCLHGVQPLGSSSSLPCSALPGGEHQLRHLTPCCTHPPPTSLCARLSAGPSRASRAGALTLVATGSLMQWKSLNANPDPCELCIPRQMS